MRIDKICKTCGFDSNGVCGMYTTCKEGEEMCIRDSVIHFLWNGVSLAEEYPLDCLDL